jgi:hypothetical protein
MQVTLRCRERVSIVVVNIHAMRQENTIAESYMRKRPYSRPFTDIAVVSDFNTTTVRIDEQFSGKPRPFSQRHILCVTGIDDPAGRQNSGTFAAVAVSLLPTVPQAAHGLQPPATKSQK